MKLRKTGITLLTLLLAATAIIPFAVAADTAIGSKNVSDRLIVTPLFSDVKINIKTPLNESEIVSFVLPEKWMKENSIITDQDTLRVTLLKKSLSPVKKGITTGTDSLIYTVGILKDNEPLVLFQFPKDTYDMLTAAPGQTITLDYPREVFTSFADSGALVKSFEERRQVRYSRQAPRVDDNPHGTAAPSRQGAPSLQATTSNLYAEWACYNTRPGRTPVALRGDIKPQTLTNQGQSFIIYHEREIYFNRNGDQIELTLMYTDNGKIYLSVPVFDEGTMYWGSNGVPSSTWIDATSKNRFYYEVYIRTNGQYSINFLDSGTGMWYRYTYNDSDNPSAHIVGITGSSELYLNGGLAHAFRATTNTIRDYGVKDTVNGNWIAPPTRFIWDQYKFDSDHHGQYVFMNGYIIGSTIYTYHDASNTDT